MLGRHGREAWTAHSDDARRADVIGRWYGATGDGDTRQKADNMHVPKRTRTHVGCLTRTRKFVAERLLLQLGVPRRYEATNPFECGCSCRACRGGPRSGWASPKRLEVKERSAFSTLDDF
jgi:hypothetical protein